LRAFSAEQLGLAQTWFDDAETQRWLGGPQWLARMLRLGGDPLGEFRGARETGRYWWLGTAMIATLVLEPDLAHVRLFVAGVEPT
jgi:hypothetical protein